MREKILNKIHELEWKNNVRSLEIIAFLKELLAELPEEKKVEVKIPKKIEVELPEEEVKEEVKATPKRKIVFRKKK
jgi:hypothetical protein